MTAGVKKACCTPAQSPRGDAREGPAFARVYPSEKNVRGMKRLEGGSFLMGTGDSDGFAADAEGPVREVMVNPFYIDPCSVTNRQFTRFVRDTNYVTDSERYRNGFVFHLLVPPDEARKVRQVVQGTEWWFVVPGACWKHPEGRGTTIKDRMDHPVVHISWHDAQAYCTWARKRLPTEAEWEYAARGGLEQKRFPWGNEREQDGKFQCNIFRGRFPDVNTAEDGFAGTAPARHFQPNGYGLYNTVGNVWEWCFDWWGTEHTESENPLGPLNGSARVMRGGSYLCHDSYCNRYRVAARTSNTPDSGTGNMGFRCVVDVPAGQ